MLPDLTVVVRNLAGGELCSISATLSWQICRLKQHIEQKLDIAMHEQRLLSGTCRSPLRNSLALETLRDGLREPEVAHAASATLDLLLVRLDSEWAQPIGKIISGTMCFSEAPEELLQDRCFILTAVEARGLLLQHVPQVYRSDVEIVSAAVAENPAAMAFASHSRSLVLAAVRCHGLALQFLSKGYREDPQIVLAAIEQDGRALPYAGKKRLQDKTIVLAAVSRCGRSLQFAAPHLRDDRDVVLTAVAEDSLALAHASTALKDDAEVVLAAITGNWRAVQFASGRLRRDSDFAIKVASLDKRALKYFPANGSSAGRSDKQVRTKRPAMQRSRQ